jgi:hypothetical protein
MNGFLKIILVLVLLVPAQFGYSTHCDYSGRLKSELLLSGRKKHQKGYNFHKWQAIFSNEKHNKTTFSYQLALLGKSDTIQFKSIQTKYINSKNKIIRQPLSTIIYSTIDFEETFLKG